MAIPAAIQNDVATLTTWRRDLHKNPEIGYDLPETSKFVADKLKEFGLDKIETGLGQCGVVGTLRGNQGRRTKGKAIMLRADMDALPMDEETGLPYASVKEGKFHGCGHDGHTTCLLGAAKYLASKRNFTGTVYFCFQPAEEGGAGAKAMIDDGLFERYLPRSIYGAHNWPSMPVGWMGFKEGRMLAASNEFWITITGKGGHGARPHETDDPLVAGAQLVLDLQTIISRSLDPVETAVLSVTEFHAGTATNVIARQARLAGTMRSFSNDVMAQMMSGIEAKCRQLTSGGCFVAEVRFDDKPYPAVINSSAPFKMASSVGIGLCGETQCVINPPAAMGSEDFAYYLLDYPVKGSDKTRKVPGCFMTFGIGMDRPMLHHPKYDFNDDAIPHMVAYWSRLVETALPAQ